MREKIIRFFDFIIYWAIILIPFSMAIAPAPMNMFMGFLIGSYLIKKIIKKGPVFTKTDINIPLLFLFAITCLSILNSINFKDTLKGGIFRLLQYIFVFFIIAEELKDKKQLYGIVLAVCFGVILTVFNEAWQLITGRDFIRGYAPIINYGLIRATASFKDANILGIYLSALAPLILGLTFYYFQGKQKIMFVFASILSLVGVALTYSRPTLLAVYVALFFFGLMEKNKKLIISLIILILAFPFLLPKSIKNFAQEVNYNPLRFMCNDDRIAIYRNSFNMIKAHPIIGLGANTYMKNYKNYKESPEYRTITTANFVYAHNNFLHLAAEIGLIGLGIFIWLLYKLLKQCVNIYRHLDDCFFKITSLSLLACLIAFLINGLTESSLYSSRVAMIFWYLAGLSIALKKFTALKT